MYNTVFVGGTFDSLHRGHKALLTRAFGEGQTVVIGITSDDYVGRLKKGFYAPLADRQKMLEAWLTEIGYKDRAKIITIHDAYEPAVSTTEFNALIITEHNRTRGEEINSIRFNKGLTPFALIEVPLIVADDGLPISSTRVQHHEIDRSGHLVMPEGLRTTLQQPLGPVLLGEKIAASIAANTSKIIVTVGDVTTKTLLDVGRVPNLAVIDLRVGRAPFLMFDEYHFPPEVCVQKIRSNAGTISQEADTAIKNWWATASAPDVKPQVFLIEGEEDLLVLPVISYGRENAVVYYGQPPMADIDSGMVEVVVTAEKKADISEILGKFE